MGSLFGDWPSYNPHNFSQLRPSDPSNPSKMTPATYYPTHDRTLPPPDQVITNEAKNILLRHMYQHSEEKLRQKRAAPKNSHRSLYASNAGILSQILPNKLKCLWLFPNGHDLFVAEN